MLDRCANCTDCPFELDAVSTNHYEIHLNVDTELPIDFVNICNMNGIKCVLIALQVDNIESDYHLMTSQRVVGTWNDMVAELDRINAIFDEYDFKVIRTKVETSPHCIGHEPLYFEGHFAVKVLKDDIPKLRDFAVGKDVHVSTNAFKVEQGLNTIMLTKRLYHDNTALFLSTLKMLRQRILELDFIDEAPRVIAEACIIDSNISLDDRWITNGKSKQEESNS